MRNQIMHKIRRIQIETKEAELDAKVKEIDRFTDTTKVYQALNHLYQKPFQNPIVHDSDGKTISNAQEIYETIHKHFEAHFTDEKVNKIEPFIGPPKPLNNPISCEEVSDAVRKLNNNKSAGNDSISAEMIKYGPPELHNQIAPTINNIFEKHEDLHLGEGILVALQKPGKTKGPVKNLRPVILLPIIRKIVSNIVLNRIQPKVDQYLSKSQAAYKRGRSTSDIVFAHKWLLARVQKYEEEIRVTGIDMTAAFDTIIRQELLDITNEFLDEDENRLIRILLSNTKLTIKSNKVEARQFESNIGSPQGDGLSGTLFNIHFKAALRKLRLELDRNDIIDEHSYVKRPVSQIMPDEAIYADDYDQISTSVERSTKFANKSKAFYQRKI